MDGLSCKFRRSMPSQDTQVQLGYGALRQSGRVVIPCRCLPTICLKRTKLRPESRKCMEQQDFWISAQAIETAPRAQSCALCALNHPFLSAS